MFKVDLPHSAHTLKSNSYSIQHGLRALMKMKALVFQPLKFREKDSILPHHKPTGKYSVTPGEKSKAKRALFYKTGGLSRLTI